MGLWFAACDLRLAAPPVARAGHHARGGNENCIVGLLYVLVPRVFLYVCLMSSHALDYWIAKQYYVGQDFISGGP